MILDAILSVLMDLAVLNAHSDFTWVPTVDVLKLAIIVKLGMIRLVHVPVAIQDMVIHATASAVQHLLLVVEQVQMHQAILAANTQELVEDLTGNPAEVENQKEAIKLIANLNIAENLQKKVMDLAVNPEADLEAIVFLKTVKEPTPEVSVLNVLIPIIQYKEFVIQMLELHLILLTVQFGDIMTSTKNIIASGLMDAKKFVLNVIQASILMLIIYVMY